MHAGAKDFFVRLVDFGLKLWLPSFLVIAGISSQYPAGQGCARFQDRVHCEGNELVSHSDR